MFKLPFLLAVSFVFNSLVSNAQNWITRAPNSSNPMDSVGYIHNLGFIECKDGEGTILSRVSNFMNVRHPGNNYSSGFSDAFDVARNAVIDSIDYVPESFSSAGRSFSAQLISLIYNVADTNAVDDAIGDIKELESSITGFDLPDKEKTALLVASSVARYSLSYNIENAADYVINNPNNSNIGYALNETSDINISQFDCSIQGTKASIDGNLFFSSSTELRFRNWFRRLLHVVLGDALGALAGATFGATLSPPLTPAIMIGCGIFGAIVGSVYAAHHVDD